MLNRGGVPAICKIRSEMSCAAAVLGRPSGVQGG
jgi:hypothetical protein